MNFADLIAKRLAELTTNINSFEAKQGWRQGYLRAVMRQDDKQTVPNILRAKEICDALGLEFYIGPSRAAPALTSSPDYSKLSPERYLPRLGLAKCSIEGWAHDRAEDAPLPAPSDLGDEDAFYVMAAGQSMIPEGIAHGDMVLVSRARVPRQGDRVWILDTNDKASIKRLVSFGEKWVHLRGWLPLYQGQQQEFHDRRTPDSLRELLPVLAVYRGHASGQMQLIPDPKAESHTQDEVIPIAHGDGGVVGFSLKWFSQHGVDPARAALVDVGDDAMSPTLPKGAVVLMNSARLRPIDRRAYVISLGGQKLVRRLEQVGEQVIILADNPSYKTQILSLDAFEILGEVFWSAHKWG